MLRRGLAPMLGCDALRHVSAVCDILTSPPPPKVDRMVTVDLRGLRLSAVRRRICESAERCESAGLDARGFGDPGMSTLASISPSVGRVWLLARIWSGVGAPLRCRRSLADAISSSIFFLFSSAIFALFFLMSGPRRGFGYNSSASDSGFGPISWTSLGGFHRWSVVGIERANGESFTSSSSPICTPSLTTLAHLPS